MSVSKTQLDRWIGVDSPVERSVFPETRKRAQDALYAALLGHQIGGVALTEGLAHDLMLLLAGAGGSPAPDARQLYASLDPASLDPQISAAAERARAAEVTNAFVFGTLEDAEANANEGVRLWPDSAELCRLTGIVALARGRHADAAANFEHAIALGAEAARVSEPLSHARWLLGHWGPGAQTDGALGTAPQPGTIPAFHRSPVQVLLLDLTSFGLYAYYWFIRNNRLAERRLGIAPTPIWHWFVPFFNVFVFYNGAATIGKRVEASGLLPAVAFVWQAVALTLISALWRLPEGWWLLSFASSFVLVSMHVSLDHAERIDFPTLGRPRLNGWEYTIIVLGAILSVLAVIGTFLPDTTPAQS